MTTPAAALQINHLSKSFGDSYALKDVSMTVQPGQIHALLGQNGSGKSTLIKVLAGIHAPDADGAASMECWGKAVSLPVHSPVDVGICIIHQDLGLSPVMSVLENLGVTQGYGSGRAAPIRWRAERKIARELFAQLEIDLPLNAMVSTLSPGEKAMLAIARAVRSLSNTDGHHLFVLDEPTTYLGGSDAERVLTLMRRVAARGDSVIFISHYLPEVLAVCDAVTVLRNGQVTARSQTADLTERDLVQMMIGADMVDFYPARPTWPAGPPALQVSGLSGGSVEDVSFTLHAGEVLGLTGLAGDGYAEIPYLLTGDAPRLAGTVTAGDGRVLSKGARQAQRCGVVVIPANRHRDGLWLHGTAQENVSLPMLGSYFRGGRLRPNSEHERAAELMQEFLVRPPRPELVTGGFSGGNQQKVVVAKWLQNDPSVLLLDEPTQGVDVGARHEILGMVRERAERGAAVILFSADHEQLAAVCSRVIVIRHGRLAGELRGEALTEHGLLERCHAA